MTCICHTRIFPISASLLNFNVTLSENVEICTAKIFYVYKQFPRIFFFISIKKKKERKKREIDFILIYWRITLPFPIHLFFSFFFRYKLNFIVKQHALYNFSFSLQLKLKNKKQSKSNPEIHLKCLLRCYLKLKKKKFTNKVGIICRAGLTNRQNKTNV